MTMKTRRLTYLLAFLGAAMPAYQAFAITPSELVALQQEGVPLRLIDVRPTARFQKGSIPGAMSVPSAVLLEKQFPPLGRVVLFADGLGDLDVQSYAQALNQRGGVQAEVLEGGYAAWRDEKGPTTAPTGLQDVEEPMITYDKLTKLKEHVVVVDLRKSAPAKAASETAVRTEPDVVKEFCQAPGREYCADPSELRKKYARRVRGRSPQLKQSAATHEPTPLIVLVDDDHLAARDQCRRFQVAGYHRVVILTGGELAIKTRGTRGLGRVGGKILDGRFSVGEEEEQKEGEEGK